MILDETKPAQVVRAVTAQTGDTVTLDETRPAQVAWAAAAQAGDTVIVDETKSAQVVRAAAQAVGTVIVDETRPAQVVRAAAQAVGTVIVDETRPAQVAWAAAAQAGDTLTLDETKPEQVARAVAAQTGDTLTLDESKPRLLVATTNMKKGEEMRQILRDANLNLDIATLDEYPGFPEVEETGETFRENAQLKAVAAAGFSGLTAIADDGGLVIDALDGRPGVHSHRFLGAETSFEEKMRRILEMMKDVPEAARTCRFRCAVVIAAPNGRIYTHEGVCEGQIARELRGAGGFGYDPIFLLPALGRHMAELTPQEKHRISHRGMALAEAIPTLRGIFDA